MGELKVRITPDNLAEVTKQIKKNFKDTGDHVEQDFTKKTAKGASSIGDASNSASSLSVKGFLDDA
jgi:hypothetical protein